MDTDLGRWTASSHVPTHAAASKLNLIRIDAAVTDAVPLDPTISRRFRTAKKGGKKGQKQCSDPQVIYCKAPLGYVN